MILIKNRLKIKKINVAQLKKDIQKVLDELGYFDFDVSFWFTTDRTIRAYNKKYRSKDKATDVLSFPFYPDLKPGQRIEAQTKDEKNLGDVIISIEYVERDAKKLSIRPNDRLYRVVVHALCHLLGYQHDTEKNYKQMKNLEVEILRLLNKDEICV